MPLATLVNATDLNRWAAERNAQAILPQLIRKLVIATVDKPRHVMFAAGEGVQLGGWDGVVEAPVGNIHVPDGVSAWELSTRGDTKTKADEDYDKRTHPPLGVIPSQTIFVFATPRRWRDKDKWVRNRQAEGIWKEVRAYDADDLETWLETAPSVHIWLSLLLGKHPQGAVGIEHFWSNWSGATDPAISADLILAGRQEAVDHIHEWARGQESFLALQAETRDEALAVFAAALQKLPLKERDWHLNRSLVVHDLPSWNQLAATQHQLNLIPMFPVDDEAVLALDNGHRIVQPLDQLGVLPDITFKIPRLFREDARKALSIAGVERERAWQLAGLARRSITSYKRTLSRHPSHRTPEWASPEHGPELLPAMLVGGWNASKEGDLSVLATLAQKPYQEYRAMLQRWQGVDDAPFRSVNDHWYMVSREDSWSLLSRHLTDEVLERFKTIVLETFGSPLPRYQLPEEDQWMANVLGKESPFSGLLYRGIAVTLAIMGARSASMSPGSGVPINDHASHIVKLIFERANQDWQIWASLSNVLPLLAEASPAEFLSAAEKACAGNPPLALHLFRDKNDELHGSAPHIGLVWALETLAWSEEHLSRAGIILAQLAAIDPGGKYTNRPVNSLVAIFHPRLNQTSAVLGRRLAVIDLIRSEEPQIAWELCNGLLPKHMGIGSYTRRPRYREWVDAPLAPIDGKEIEATHTAVVQCMLEDVADDGAKWAGIIESLPPLSSEDFDSVITRLAAIEPDALPDADRSTIWHTLREQIAHHKHFPDAAWSHSAERLEKLEHLFPRFQPSNLLESNAWLFEKKIGNLLEGKGSWEDKQRQLNLRQRKTLAHIWDELGSAGLVELARIAKNPGLVGGLSGEMGLIDGECQSILKEYLNADDSQMASFALGVTEGLISYCGRDLTESLLDKMRNDLTPEQIAHFLFALPLDVHTWHLTEDMGVEVCYLYWDMIGPYLIYRTKDQQVAIENLLKYNHPDVAVEMLGMLASGDEGLQPELAIQALENLLRADLTKDLSLSAHSLYDLFKYLRSCEKVSLDQIASLEWAYLPALQRLGEGVDLQLHQVLRDHPDFFVTVVCSTFPELSPGQQEYSDEEREKAMRARELLGEWRMPVPPDDDPSAILRWVKATREQLINQNKLSRGDKQIGIALSGPAVGADGIWPHESVREVIEEIKSTRVEQGLFEGVAYKGEVSWRGAYAGGSQRRERAQTYYDYACQLRERCPRTASVATRIGELFEREARWEDLEAELEQDTDL